METTGTPPPFDAELAGAQFRPKESKQFLDDTIAQAVEPLQFTLHRDYLNAYDMFAVEVHLGPHFVGFINRQVAQWLGQWIDAGHEYSCVFLQLDETGKRRHLLRCLPTGKRILTKDELEAEEAPF